jgi:hypothetical protein
VNVVSLKAPQTTALVRYDAMCKAIAAAYAVDEVKDIRDQAIALEVYARQAHNIEAERQACEIRLRAERQAGKLSAKLEKKPGRRTDKQPVGVVPTGSNSKWITSFQSGRPGICVCS